ncbi:MAG: DUF3597 domain-containing protein [Verrucomicrobiota bacterium]
MNIFKTIMSKIFGHDSAGASTVGSAPTPATQSNTGSATASNNPSSPASKAGEAQPRAPISSVDVAAVLNDLAAKNPEKLDWKRSIVDLMKLLDMDSSLSSRKQLARELQYSSDQSDSATMNVWLHKQVLQKLAENGGKVPADLLD